MADVAQGVSREPRFRMGERVEVTCGLLRGTRGTVQSSGGSAGHAVLLDSGQIVGVECEHLRKVC